MVIESRDSLFGGDGTIAGRAHRASPTSDCKGNYVILAFRHGGAFAKICQQRYHCGMTTMNISLPDSLKDFVDEQVNQRGYGTSSEYVRELIRKEQDRLQLRGLLLAGASSAPTKPVDGAYFEGLRKRVRATKSGARR